jgi:nitroreductase
METWEAIRSRRNVRSFEDRAIPEDHLNEILEAGRRSPSSQNWQPWDFVLVTSRELLAELARTWQGGGHVAHSAATVVLVASPPDQERRRNILYYDLGQATMSMMLAAVGLGIGSGHSSVGDQDLAREILGLPADKFCAFMISFGYPADRPLSLVRRPNRRPADEVIHRERWLSYSDDRGLLYPAVGIDGQQADRALRLAPSVGGRARIEDPQAARVLVERDVRMSEDDEADRREPSAQPRQPAGRGAAVVQHRHAEPVQV